MANTLQLADGTGTNIQEQPTQPVTAKFKFQSGNYDDLSNISNTVTTIRQTILPIFTAALIELLGDDTSIKFDTFNASFVSEKGRIDIIVNITVKINKWIRSDVSKEAVNQDAQYVLNQLKVVPNVNWQNCTINTNDGSLNLRFVI